MKHKKIYLIFILFLTFINFANAQTNVAFIDMTYIMENSLAGKSLKKQLENLHKKNLRV